MTAVRAMERLPEWEFVVLGDGSQREQLEQVRREDVHYLGTVQHELIPGFLHQSTVGISLVDDRNTLKLLEYGPAGIPAVSVKGDAETRFSGLVQFCSLDPRAVAKAIQQARMSNNVDAYQKFVQQFSWRSIADQYEQACKRAVA